MHIFTFKALSCLDLTFAASKGVSLDTPPAAPFHYHRLLAGAGPGPGPVQGWPDPCGLGPGSSMFKPNGNCFFISSGNLTEDLKNEVCIVETSTLCVRRKVLNYDCGLLSLIRINIVWPGFWWNTPQYKDTWILSISSGLWYLKYFLSCLAT